jgi:hypothetical protein
MLTNINVISGIADQGLVRRFRALPHATMLKLGALDSVNVFAFPHPNEWLVVVKY